MPETERRSKSKMRMPVAEKRQFVEVFENDFGRIMKTVQSQLVAQVEDARAAVLREEGLDDVTTKVRRLQAEVEAKKVELQRVREQMQHEIFLLEKKLKAAHDGAMGVMEGPPEVELLRELGFDHDAPIDGRKWYGVAVRNRLDAMACVRVARTIDPAAPVRAIERIGEAVRRELLLSASYEDVSSAYDKFYELNFQQYGVEMPPRLDDLRRLSGGRLLTVGTVEDVSRLLPASAEDAGE